MDDNAKEKASFYPHTCTAGKNINEKGEMRQFPPNKHPHGSYITVWRRITLTNVPNVWIHFCQQGDSGHSNHGLLLQQQPSCGSVWLTTIMSSLTTPCLSFTLSRSIFELKRGQKREARNTELRLSVHIIYAGLFHGCIKRRDSIEVGPTSFRKILSRAWTIKNKVNKQKIYKYTFTKTVPSVGPLEHSKKCNSYRDKINSYLVFI